MSKGARITYSRALNELEKIVQEIEDEDIDIDLLAEKVKRAAFLVKFCRGRLRSAEDDLRNALKDVEKTGDEGNTEEDDRED